MKQPDLHPVFETLVDILRPTLEPTTPMRLELDTPIKIKYYDNNEPYIHQPVSFVNANAFDTISDVDCWISTTWKCDLGHLTISDIVCKNQEEIKNFDPEKLEEEILKALQNKI
jgi:hypothetical protein